MRPTTRLSVLSLSVAILVTATPSDARRRTKSIDRAVQDGWQLGWCPLTLDDVLDFTADGPTARVTFVVNFQPGQRLDNVYVVETDAVSSYTLDDETCFRGSIYSIRAPNPPEVLGELFDNEANGWTLSGASLAGGSAPRIPFDVNDQTGAALALEPGGSASFDVTGLIPGRQYTAGAWWYADFEESHLSIEVDSHDPGALSLNGGRFEVRATWTDHRGNQGAGTAIPLTDDTGFFWFFNSRNVEVVVKVLNACSFTNRYWVFAAGLTDVEVDLTVVDTLRGGPVWTYHNPRRVEFQPVLDTAAFATCP